MRLAIVCALFAAAAHAEGITIVLDFEGRYSEQAVAEMKREFEGILRQAPITVDWRNRQQAQQEAFANLVVVRFKGKCALEPVPYLYDERGPMAFSFATESGVQPFGEIECEKVANVLRTAMFGPDYGQANQLLGRALGRVLVHEVVHMLSGSSAHGREGIARPSLSGSELIAPKLKLAPEDLKRLSNPRQ